MYGVASLNFASCGSGAVGHGDVWQGAVSSGDVGHGAVWRGMAGWAKVRNNSVVAVRHGAGQVRFGGVG